MDAVHSRTHPPHGTRADWRPSADSRKSPRFPQASLKRVVAVEQRLLRLERDADGNDAMTLARLDSECRIRSRYEPATRWPRLTQASSSHIDQRSSSIASDTSLSALTDARRAPHDARRHQSLIRQEETIMNRADLAALLAATVLAPLCWQAPLMPPTVRRRVRCSPSRRRTTCRDPGRSRC